MEISIKFSAGYMRMKPKIQQMQLFLKMKLINESPFFKLLRKKLLFLQVKMIIIKSQNKEENLYENILEDLERKL